jgi:hypothetical protein
MNVYNFCAIEENHVIISDSMKDAINIFVGYRMQNSSSRRYRYVPYVIEYFGESKGIRTDDHSRGTLCIQNVWEVDGLKETFYERYDVKESEFKKDKIY